MAEVLGSAPRACGQVGLQAAVETRCRLLPTPHGMARLHAPPPSRDCLHAGTTLAVHAGLQALRRNPYAPTVPCHRVIAASLELGGFSGSWGAACANVKKKRGLLAQEGVHFDEAGRLEAGSRGAVMGAAELSEAAAAVL
jgi:alkylated DNA nucleotide flippase Atl1